MPEHPQLAPNPEYLRSLKDTLFAQWRHLPPEHQATTALALLAEVLSGPHGPWLLEAIALRDATSSETVSPDDGSRSPTLHPDHFSDLPVPFQPESESVDAMAYARLYLPGSTRAWYPSAFDGQDLFFGLVVEAVLRIGMMDNSKHLSRARINTNPGETGRNWRREMSLAQTRPREFFPPGDVLPPQKESLTPPARQE